MTLPEASALYSLQYLAAIVGKLAVGYLVRAVPRRLNFTAAPIAFTLAHLLLVEPPGGWAHPFAPSGPAAAAAVPAGALPSLLAWARVLRVATSQTRRLSFAFVYGSSFGVTHSLLTVQPAHLFGRLHLPYLQTLLMATYVLGVSAGQVGSGWAYDAAGERYGPALLLTFGVSIVNVACCQVLAGAKGWQDQEREPAGAPTAGALL